MPRPYILAETNWKHLKDESFDLAILPFLETKRVLNYTHNGKDKVELELR